MISDTQMEIGDVLSSNPDVVSGAIMFPGTRVPVTVLVENLAGGESLDDFLENFPTVTREQAVAALKVLGELAQRVVKQHGRPSAEGLSDRIVCALDRSIVKAAELFARLAGDKTLWWAPESLLLVFAILELSEEFRDDPNIRIRPECPTTDLPNDVVVPSATRAGRIDLVISDDNSRKFFPIEFKRYVNYGATSSDFKRVASLVTANPLMCRGFLAGPMYQTKDKKDDWPIRFDAELAVARDTYVGLNIARRRTDFVDGLFVNNKSELHCVAAVVVEIST